MTTETTEKLFRFTLLIQDGEARRDPLRMERYVTAATAEEALERTRKAWPFYNVSLISGPESAAGIVPVDGGRIDYEPIAPGIVQEARASCALDGETQSAPAAPPPEPVLETVVYNRKELIRALSLAGKGVGRRALKPILSYARINHAISATNLEVSIRATIAKEGTFTNPICVPMERTLAVLKSLTSERVALRADPISHKVTIALFADAVGPEGTYVPVATVPGENAEEFPIIPENPGVAFCIAIEGEILRVGLERTVFAAAKERSRFAFNGVRFQVDGDDVLRIIATDGKRMAVQPCPVTNPKGLKTGHIVPTSALKVVLDALKDLPKSKGRIKPGNLCALTFDDRDVVFSLNTGVVIRSRLVDGAFPKYESVIPRDGNAEFLVNREAFIAALKQVRVTTNEESRSVKIEPSGEPNELRLTSRAADVWESVALLSAHFHRWLKPIKPHTIAPAMAFNPDFLIEGLEAFDGATDVEILLVSVDCPIRIRHEGTEYIYVVMPVTMRAA